MYANNRFFFLFLRSLFSIIYAYLVFFEDQAAVSTTIHDPVQWYNALQRWSVRNVDAFWAAVWTFYKLPSYRPFSHAFVPGKVLFSLI